jgi:hypothetical protein
VQSLSTLIANLNDALTPAPDDVYVKALTKLIEFSMAFGIPSGDPEAMQRIYREKLGDLPGDLLMRAIIRVTDKWTWGNRLPMPAEIRAVIAGELSYRRTLLTKARVALLKARDDVGVPSNDNSRIAPEKWTELRNILNGAAKKLNSSPRKDD